MEELPQLPQTAVLQRAVRGLSADPSVRAIWLGGSFAQGTADAFSDIDLRIAVPAAQLGEWAQPDWQAVFGQRSVAATLRAFGDDAFLHHVVLPDGTMIDLFVQSTERDNPEHAVKALACRDKAFAERLARFEQPTRSADVLAEPTVVRGLLTDYWINSHKHRKVLARGLPLLAVTGVHHERTLLSRLWYVQATGRDMPGQPSIHSLTSLARSVQEALGPRALELIGMPLRSEAEIVAAVEAMRAEVADVGCALARRYDFEYPNQLEQVVRASWQR